MSKTNIDNDELSTAASRQWERGNLREARRLFLVAAENGDVSSQGSLAIFCEFGYAGPRDLDRAKYWYRKAIRGGCSVSVYNFADFYGKLGNRRRMFFWLHRSAESDDSGGMLMLAKELLKGRSPNARNRAKKLLRETVNARYISEDDKEEAEAILSSLGEPVKQPCAPDPVSPTGAAGYFDRATAWYDKGEYNLAIADFDESIRQQPNVAGSYYSRGLAWYDKGNYDRAIADCGEAIRLQPDHADAYNNRGLAWGGKGDYDRAIADYDEAIRLQPDHANAYNNRGNAWKNNSGDCDRAIADYSEAIRLRPYFVSAHFNRGLAWAAKGEYDRAIDDYSVIICWYGDDAGAYNNRGLAWDEKGEYDNAIADYGVAIHLQPGDADAYNNRGLSYFTLGRYTDAAADLQISQSIDPNYDGALCLYLARERSGKSGREELSANAKRLDLTQWPGIIVRHYLGQDREEAVLAAARDADPAKQREQECEAFFYLGQAHLLKGDTTEAIDYFRKVVDTGVTGFIQYEMAGAELKRLGHLR